MGSEYYSEGSLQLPSNNGGFEAPSGNMQPIYPSQETFFPDEAYNSHQPAPQYQRPSSTSQFNSDGSFGAYDGHEQRVGYYSCFPLLQSHTGYSTVFQNQYQQQSFYDNISTLQENPNVHPVPFNPPHNSYDNDYAFAQGHSTSLRMTNFPSIARIFH